MLSPLARQARKRHAHRTAPCRSCRAGACGCVDGASEPPACVPPIELSSMRCTGEPCQMTRVGRGNVWQWRWPAEHASASAPTLHSHACMQQAEHGSSTHLQLEEHVQRAQEEGAHCSRGRGSSDSAGHGSGRVCGGQLAGGRCRHPATAAMPLALADPYRCPLPAFPSANRTQHPTAFASATAPCTRPLHPTHPPALISMAARLLSLTVMAPPRVARPCRILDMRAFCTSSTRSLICGERGRGQRGMHTLQ